MYKFRVLVGQKLFVPYPSLVTTRKETAPHHPTYLG